MKVENTCSIVTGGSKGIGRAIVELIVSKGGNVIIGDVLDKEGQEVADSINKSGKKRAVFVHCDVSKLEELKNLFKVADEEFGGAQIMFNNAGINEPEYPYTDLGSTSAREPCKEFPFYSFTKNSVWHFTHIMSQLNWENIRVNCIAPGYTRTDILKDGDVDETEILESTIGLLEPPYIASKMLELVEDDKANGVVKWVELEGDQLASKVHVISANEEVAKFLANSNKDGKEENVPMN
ncbi:NAD(P)-binding protein [Conidiobolus coronatus NRRL 28638]|uniref:NAD(P)-binding protein n=1 Tax=Conidiobolus coronatus (strain ATCC 28846 / CBS 209.66 / NRRL 28638) TaxID=796925 RepID=A0A137P8Q0_CONC2|nr:NAD(P)-binding protein [Conidiobolus coronatus NRRL 28638]|eukprot:KXN71380.1 NAD(P)-binding protein [Conidiobolus coronatus NRRL 28638]